jgi:hypothetical protein
MNFTIQSATGVTFSFLINSPLQGKDYLTKTNPYLPGEKTTCTRSHYNQLDYCVEPYLLFFNCY